MKPLYGGLYLGYLLKFTKTNTVFPNKYILAESFKSTPLQRTEIKAWRDSSNYLHRITSPNHKSKLVFTVMGEDGDIKLSELREILDMLNKAYSLKSQRKLSIKYWDDELLNYRTMTAYIPDINYVKEQETNDDIIYQPFELTFIEY